MTLKRNTEIVWGSGNSQTPAYIVPGPVEVTGKMTFGAVDETDWLLYFSNTQPITSLTLQDSGTDSVQIVMTKTAFMDPTAVERTKEYPMINASFESLYNATDAGPVAITVTNSKSTGY